MSAVGVTERLREAGVRVTRQRIAVLEALRERTDALSAQDLYLEFRRAGDPIGLSTIYRSLESLEEAGLLDVLQREGESAYRFCSTDHHHHLICTGCNEVEELEAGLVEEWVRKVSAAHTFEVTGHRADIYGRCRNCASDAIST